MQAAGNIIDRLFSSSLEEAKKIPPSTGAFLHEEIKALETTLAELNASYQDLKNQFELLLIKGKEKRDINAIHHELCELKMKLQALYEFMSASLPDPILLSDVQKRPSFNEFFGAMLTGSNKELDDLKFIKLVIGKLRQLFQEKLIIWKSKLSISDSLDKEFAVLDFPQTAFKMTTEEMVASITTVVEKDMESLFQQIEANIKNPSSSDKELEQELKQQITQLEKNSSLLTHQLEVTNENLHTVQANFNLIQDEFDKSQNKIRELTKQLTLSKAALEKFNQENERLIDQLNDSSSSKEIRLQLEEETENVRRISLQFQKEVSASSSLKCTLDSTEEALKIEERKYREKMGELHDLHRTLDTLKKEFEDYKIAANESLAVEYQKKLESERRRLEIEKMCENLREKCLTQLKIETDVCQDRVIKDFALNFIQQLDAPTQERFRIMFLEKFRKRITTQTVRVMILR